MFENYRLNSTLLVNRWGTSADPGLEVSPMLGVPLSGNTLLYLYDHHHYSHPRCNQHHHHNHETQEPFIRHLCWSRGELAAFYLHAWFYFIFTTATWGRCYYTHPFSRWENQASEKLYSLSNESIQDPGSAPQSTWPSSLCLCSFVWSQTRLLTALYSHIIALTLGRPGISPVWISAFALLISSALSFEARMRFQ